MIDNIILVGLGSIGSKYLKIIREIYPKMYITLVRSGKHKKSSLEKKVDNVTYSLEQAINENSKAAIIASPATLHLEQLAKLIENGIHVLVEKPLSHSLDKIGQVASMINHSNLIVQIGYCFRHDHSAKQFLKMQNERKHKKILDVKIVSSSFLPDWRSNKPYSDSVSANNSLGGGVLNELSHEIDYAIWFFGRIDNIYSNLNNTDTLNIDVEDSAFLIVEHSMGYNITIDLNFNCKNTKRYCSITYIDGILTWDILNREILWNSFDNENSKLEFDYDFDDMYRNQIRHFLDCLDNSLKPIPSFKEAKHVLEVIAAARKSNNNKSRVSI